MTVSATARRTPVLAAESLAPAIADQQASPPRAGSGLPSWWPQSLAHGGAGIALLHIERAASGHGNWNRVRAWLEYVTSSDISLGPNASLYFGAPAVEFVLRSAAPYLPGGAGRTLAVLEGATDQVIRHRLDAARERLVSGARPPLKEFDGIRGLSGLGALLLRRDPASALLGDVLNHLVASTEPVIDGEDLLPGWWTDLGPGGLPSPDFPGGHANSGMAHGVGAILATLALAMRHGATVPGQVEAMNRICAWLDQWRQDGDQSSWWPYWINRAQLHTPQMHTADGPRRPSWCYGTVGLARAQQLAGLAQGNPQRQALAEDAAAAALADPAQLHQTTDASLCHGYAGLIRIAALMAGDSPAPGVFTGLIPDLLAQTLTQRVPEDPGWLEGTAGIALALHSVSAGPVTGWDRALLVA